MDTRLKDFCLEGDFSASYYDGKCLPEGMTTGYLDEWKSDGHGSAVEIGGGRDETGRGDETSLQGDEYLTAYQRARKF
jgi:hypothetical protein